MIRRILCTCVWMSCCISRSAADRPNVLFIAVDDLNDWIGCLDGHPQAMTPHIDALARRGMLFTNAHCPATACSPSRAAVFSGQRAWKTGVWSNDSKKFTSRYPDQVVLPKAFAAAGYTTLGTGKMMHSKSANKRYFQHSMITEQRWSPLMRDQTEYTTDELVSKGTNHPRHTVKRAGRADVVLPLNSMPSDRRPDSASGESFDWGPFDVPDADMGDAKITDWAIDRITNGFDKPFFLGVGYYRPHIPLWAPQKYFARFEDVAVRLPPFQIHDLDDLSSTAQKWALEPVTAGSHSTVVRHGQWQEAVKAYLACVTFVDHHIGRLVAALDASPYRDNTVVVLWSDHGWHLGEKEHWGKWTGWERSTRVPLIIAPPGNRTDFTEAGTQCHEPVCLIDLYPTLAELCDITPPYKLHGQSLVPLLRHPETPTGRTVLTTFDQGNVSLRDRNWRYIRYADGSEELYHLQTDPHEWTNLAADPSHEDRRIAFQNVLDKYRKHIP